MLHGTVAVPGDKSITHRAVLFGAIADGVTEIVTETFGRDNMATVRIVQQLGISVQGTVPDALFPIVCEEGLEHFGRSPDGMTRILVHGKGLFGLRKPTENLNCGNSGTTARLLSGLLAAQDFSATLVGDESLSRRPFARVTKPLSQMGAVFSSDMLPMTIFGAREKLSGGISGIRFSSPQASAQVKSAILLAGLYSDNEVWIDEPRLSRDHTERMFSAFGVTLECGKTEDGRAFVLLPAKNGSSAVTRKLRACPVEVPRDFSAAAFFLVAGSIFPGSKVTLPGVGVNETRVGLLQILRRMGANISLQNNRDVCGEPVADLLVNAAPLHGIEVTPEEVVLGIDEIPALAMAAAVARGRTVITGAGELRVKESDRLATTAAIIKSFGGQVEELPDGLVIEGRPEREGLCVAEASSPWRSSGDHRIAMSGALLDLLIGGRFEIKDKIAVETSFPGFIERLQAVVCL